MLLKPEGLAGRRVRPIAPTDDELDAPRDRGSAAPHGRPAGVAPRECPAFGRARSDSRRARGRQALRRRRGPRRGRPGRPARRHHRADRPQRRRQDHVLQHRDRPHLARRGPHRVRGHQHRGTPAERDRRARDRAHLPVDPALPADDRAGERAGGRALPPARERTRRRAASGIGRGRRGPRSRAGARAARVHRPRRQRRRSRAQPAVRRPAPARDRPRARDRAAAPPARRADRGHEPARDREPDRP